MQYNKSQPLAAQISPPVHDLLVYKRIWPAFSLVTLLFRLTIPNNLCGSKVVIDLTTAEVQNHFIFKYKIWYRIKKKPSL